MKILRHQLTKALKFNMGRKCSVITQIFAWEQPALGAN